MNKKVLLPLLAVGLSLTACTPKAMHAGEEPTLKSVLDGKFLIGAALNSAQIMGQDTGSMAIVRRHFSAVVAENCMKSSVIHPEENRYDFSEADSLVSFALRNNIAVTGHCLIWHSQLSPWFCMDDDGKEVSPEVLRRRMRDHIHTVVGRYKGVIRGWDVVNEAIIEDGSYRDSPFFRILGKEFIPLAFRYAQEADPQAELYYNDYGMDTPGRRDAVVRLVNELKAEGLRIDAVGMQGHMGMEYPSLHAFEESMLAFAATGVKVMVTEWDMSALPTPTRSANISDTASYRKSLNPYPDYLPDSVAHVWNGRMADFLRLFIKHSDIVTRVTAWGVTDKDSWKNGFPVQGRKDYPLLFDRAGQPKAFIKELLQPKKAAFTDYSYTGEVPNADGMPLLPGCYPDPSVCRVGDDYYLVNSTFGFFPGIPIRHSNDLKTWSSLGFVLNRAEQLPLYTGINVTGQGIYAPAISYNPHNQTFYLITTDVGGMGNFYVTTDNPKAGSWSNPVLLPDVGGIDPSFFFDDDGRAYIVNNDAPEGKTLYEGHRAIWIREFDPVQGVTKGQARMLVDGGVDISTKPIWIEGPHLYRVGDTYYLMAAEGGTATDHSEVIFSSSSPTGQFVPCKVNPILTQRDLPAGRSHAVTSTGHADLVQTPDGEWYAFFLGVRPYRDGHDMMGRETFMHPVTWEDGQPVILPKGTALNYGIRPKVTQTPTPAEFVSDAFCIRTPQTLFHSIAGDALLLDARAVGLGEWRQPAAMGHWVTCNDFAAAVTLAFRPEDAGDFAGFCLFHDDNHYIRFGKAMDESGTPVVLLEAVSAGIVTYTTQSTELPSGEALRLYIIGSEKGCFSFAFGSGDTDHNTPIGRPVSADLLSTRTAGGFTGIMLGLYANGTYQQTTL
jgi:beta-xylosidase/GH35 family endo-1,4-beta-xylanase